MGNSQPALQNADAIMHAFPKDFRLVSPVQNVRYGRGNLYEHTKQNVYVFEKVIAVEDPQHLQLWKDTLKRHQSFSNEQVVKLLAYTIHEDESLCSMSAMEIKAYYEYIGESIAQRLQSTFNRQQSIKEGAIWYVLYKMARVLSYLYSCKHYENMITLSTILINHRGQIKVLPNLFLASDADYCTRITNGITDYIDPSLLDHLHSYQASAQAKMKNDSYALGIVLIEMATRTRIRINDSVQINTLLTQCSQTLSPSLASYINQLVSPAERRPFLTEVDQQLRLIENELAMQWEPLSEQKPQDNRNNITYLSLDIDQAQSVISIGSPNQNLTNSQYAKTVTIPMDEYLQLLQQSKSVQFQRREQFLIHQIEPQQRQPVHVPVQSQYTQSLPLKQAYQPPQYRQMPSLSQQLSPRRTTPPRLQPQYQPMQTVAPTLRLPNQVPLPNTAPQPFAYRPPQGPPPQPQVMRSPPPVRPSMQPIPNTAPPQNPPQYPPQYPPPPPQAAPPPNQFQGPSLYLQDPNVQKADNKPYEYQRPNDMNHDLEQKFQRAMNNAAQALQK